MKTATTSSTLNEIIESLGITQSGIYPQPCLFEYNGKRIPRPTADAAWLVVKREFGIDSDLLKHDGYIER